MVLQSFYVQKRKSSSNRRVQPSARQCPKVILSKEARTALRLNQRAKSLQFKNALEEAWKQLDNTMKTIAVSHHKSIRRVQNDLYIGRGTLRSKRSKLNLWNAFCWKKNQDAENRMITFFSLRLCSCIDIAGNYGKATLQSIVQDHKTEYLALSKEEQDKLLVEFAEWKQSKSTGVRTSTKSKINDITHTLKAVENEVCYLLIFLSVSTMLTQILAQ